MKRIVKRNKGGVMHTIKNHLSLIMIDGLTMINPMKEWKLLYSPHHRAEKYVKHPDLKKTKAKMKLNETTKDSPKPS